MSRLALSLAGPEDLAPRPAAILMGGAAGNALSVARSLGRHGTQVYVLPDTPDVHSRYAAYVGLPAAESPQASWARYLLSAESDPFRGAVLLACSDAGIELLIDHREELAEKFVLDASDSAAQRCLLSKRATYDAARAAGVPTPLFWSAESMEEIQAHRDEYVYPLIIKPLYSHRFQAVFHEKFFRATDYGDLLEACRLVREHGIEAVLLEEIPGPDDRLCSYYTYIDESGEPLCDFTKRVIRRYPENRGLACYHVTDWNPEARDLGLRLFSHVGLSGVGNVEFKRDERDGKLKVIECNARFTAGNALLAASGYDIALFVYNRLVGVSQPPLKGRGYEQGLHYWFPVQDAYAFLALRAQGRMTWAEWLASLAHRQVTPYFRWDDPMPSLVELGRFGRHIAEAGVRRGMCVVRSSKARTEGRRPHGARGEQP